MSPKCARMRFRRYQYHHDSEMCDSNKSVRNGAWVAVTDSKSHKKSGGTTPQDIGLWCETRRVYGVRDG